jgi:hypothetical protein
MVETKTANQLLFEMHGGKKTKIIKTAAKKPIAAKKPVAAKKGKK